MTRLFPFVVGASAMVSTALGGAATQITGDWTVDLRTVCAVGGVVIPSVWWLGTKFKGITDQLSSAEKVFTEFEKKFSGLQDRLDKLPCHGWNAEDYTTARKKSKE